MIEKKNGKEGDRAHTVSLLTKGTKQSESSCNKYKMGIYLYLLCFENCKLKSLTYLFPWDEISIHPPFDWFDLKSNQIK